MRQMTGAPFLLGALLAVSLLLGSCTLFQENSALPETALAEPAHSPQIEQEQPTPLPTPLPPTSTATPATQASLDVSYLPGLEDLDDGWNQITPGGETTCARGGDYQFFVRKADSNRLLIYFEGGGSCYDVETCRPGGHYFDDGIDPDVLADNPAKKTTGVFALDDERNPFYDYNMVFVSYCSGDGFMGNRQVTYGQGDKAFQVSHFGFLNTTIVLNWTYTNFPQPESIFVLGCSAGTVGSFFHAPYLLEQYPHTPVVMVGDSGGGFLDAPASYAENFGFLSLLPTWIPEYEGLVDGNLHTELLFSIPAQHYPQARFGLLDTYQDAVQEGIIFQLGRNQTLKDVVTENLTKIQSTAPGFVSYSGPGNYHCITMEPMFMEYEVNGVKLRDWIGDLARGQAVQSVAP